MYEGKGEEKGDNSCYGEVEEGKLRYIDSELRERLEFVLGKREEEEKGEKFAMLGSWGRQKVLYR